MQTMNDLFMESIEKFGSRPAITDGDRTLTYGELGEAVKSLASFLVSRGVGSGDRVAILLPNSMEFAAAFFASASLGAISVPVNNLCKEDEIRFYMTDSGAKVLLTDAALKEIAEKAVSGSGADVAIVRGGGADWVYLKGKAGNSAPAKVEARNDAIFLYSTGSTGKPKRVARTHYNLAALAQNHSYTAGFTYTDRVLFVVPLSHTYAFGNFISSIRGGAASIMLEQFNRNRVLDVLEKEAVTIFPTVPVMLDALAGTFTSEEKDLSHLRLVISAGAPLREETFKKFHERFSIYPRQLYGSTETGVISINLAEDIEKRSASVGRPVKHVIVKVFSDGGEELETGAEGELAVRSPSMTRGYDGLPDETAKVFRNGYYFTGDLGRIDAEGYIYITGRRKFFINAGGYKVDPAEVENVLLGMPGITEAAVLGVEDKSGKEHVKAVLVSERPVTAGEVVEHCRGKLADYKIPLSIEFRKELPRSPAGKVLKERLK